MSNFKAIAATTSTLRRVLNETVSADVAGAQATAVRPIAGDDDGLPDPGVNVFLYQVTPNTAWRNMDLPTRSRTGHVVERPRIALDLHYLLTFYGDEGELLPQQLLGCVVRTLHTRSILSRDAVQATIDDPAFAYVADSDLAEEVELVKLTPMTATVEELSNLWSVLLQTPYALSICYLATVVLIEADERPRRGLPVLERDIRVSTFRRARITAVISEESPSEPIEVGDTIVVEGEALDGPIDHIRVGAAELLPVPDSVTPSELRVDLLSPDLRAGVQGLRIVYQDETASTVAALVVRPLATLAGPVTATEVPLDFDPLVGRDQDVELILNELNPPTDRAPFAYSFKSPADNGITDPNIQETNSITFEISDVEPAIYLMRVVVAGAESVLDRDDDDTSLTFGFFIGPTIDLT